MYQLLDFRKSLEWFALPMGAIAVIIWAIRVPREPIAMVETLSLAGVIAVGFLVLVGETRLFHRLWKTSLVRKHLFPFIPGKYEGTISSNWSVISAIRAGATGSGGLVDAELHVDRMGNFDKLVTVEIKASLFRASMKLIPKDGYTDSQTIWLRPVAEGEAGHPRLFYMYRSITQSAPKATDVHYHFGAAYLDVIQDGDQLKLRGVYWTERDWPRGNNTSGAINVTRL